VARKTVRQLRLGTAAAAATVARTMRKSRQRVVVRAKTIVKQALIASGLKHPS
jgi:hypothetical protein